MAKNKLKKIPELSLIIKIYILSLTAFSIFRLILFLTNLDRLDHTDGSTNIFKAFVMGIRFDTTITGYIVFLPALILLTEYIINKRYAILNKIIFYWILLLFSISFVISAADIPYFNQFFSRFSVGAFEWADNLGFVFKMIVEEPKYIIAVVPFIIINYLFYRILKNIFKKYYKSVEQSSPNNGFPIAKILGTLLILSIIFLGIRGRIQKKSPIRIGTAYFCEDPFLNQLGLNPVFTLMRSYLDNKNPNNKAINLMDNQVAIQNVRKYLNINNQDFSSPIAREISPDSIAKNKPNVVLIIMESMSAAKMKRYGNKDNLTPFLDSLSYQSYYFDNYYTAGEHTFNGIFSTLFSFPALYRFHPLKQIKEYTGIAHTLKSLGYTTNFFITHDGQFDNVEGFLHANSFDNIFSQSNYPSKEVKTTLGVPDDYMFRYAIPILNKQSEMHKPFFASFMTASDHGPFYLPEYFKPHTSEIRKQIVEYADWSLKRFIQLASKQKWFDNTIFVFTADHGAGLNVKYPISLNYHHSPLIIYAPKLLEPNTYNKISGQIDIFPTIMGILKQKYINNTLGIDLIHENRPYTIINGDDKVGALDQKFLFILKNNSEKSLYLYTEQNRKNVIKDYPEKAKEMEEYLKSNLQTYQYMLSTNKIKLQNKTS